MRKCVDRADAQPAPQLKVKKNGGGTMIELDHPDKDVAMARLAEALGTTDLIFSMVCSGKSSTPSLRERPFDEAKLNFVLALVKGVKPRDELEAMLATRMAAVHLAIMTLAQRLAQVAGNSRLWRAGRVKSRHRRLCRQWLDRSARHRAEDFSEPFQTLEARGRRAGPNHRWRRPAANHVGGRIKRLAASPARLDDGASGSHFSRPMSRAVGPPNAHEALSMLLYLNAKRNHLCRKPDILAIDAGRFSVFVPRFVSTSRHAAALDIAEPHIRPALFHAAR